MKNNNNNTYTFKLLHLIITFILMMLVIGGIAFGASYATMDNKDAILKVHIDNNKELILKIDIVLERMDNKLDKILIKGD